MENFRKNFFQILLVITALVFTICIRYLYENSDTKTGAFGNMSEQNITVSDIFNGKCRGGDAE